MRRRCQRGYAYALPRGGNGRGCVCARRDGCCNVCRRCNVCSTRTATTSARGGATSQTLFAICGKGGQGCTVSSIARSSRCASPRRNVNRSAAGGSVESFRTGKTGNAEWKALGPGPGWRGNENSPGDEVVPRMAETVNTKHLIDNFTRRPLTPVAPPRAERCFQKEDGPPRKLECTTDRAHPPSQSQPQ